MQSLFSAICILFMLIQKVLVSATRMGYDCDQEFIHEYRLNDIVKHAKAADKNKFLPSEMKKLSDRYQGPPFRKSYLLWPVSSEKMSYERAITTPYRAVLNDDLEVFSVIMMRRGAVRECRMRDESSSVDNYRCGGIKGIVYTRDFLGDAAYRVCSKITEVASRTSPLRYDGPPFEGPVRRQLYIAPLMSTHMENFVVFDTKCNVAGAVTKEKDSNFIKCKKWLFNKPDR